MFNLVQRILNPNSLIKFSMKKLIVCLFLLATVAGVQAQLTTIKFNGTTTSARQPWTTNGYTEAGFAILVSDYWNYQFRTSPALGSATAYMASVNPGGDTFTITNVSGSQFVLHTIDMANWNGSTKAVTGTVYDSAGNQLATGTVNLAPGQDFSPLMATGFGLLCETPCQCVTASSQNSGTLIGFDNIQLTTVTPTLEPSTSVLSGLGGAALLFWRRRKSF